MAYQKLDDTAVSEVEAGMEAAPQSQPPFEANGPMQNNIVDCVRVYRKRVRIEQSLIHRNNNVS